VILSNKGKTMEKTVAITYRTKEAGDLTLRVLNVEELKDLHEEVFGTRETFSSDPVEVADRILDEMQAKHDIYGEYVAEKV